MFLRPVQSVQIALTVTSGTPRDPAPNAFAALAWGRGCVCWGSQGSSSGAGPAVSDDLM